MDYNREPQCNFQVIVNIHASNKRYSSSLWLSTYSSNPCPKLTSFAGRTIPSTDQGATPTKILLYHKILPTSLCAALGPRGTLDLPGFRTVDVVSRDPIRVVGGSRRNCRAVRCLTDGGGFAIFRCAGRLLGELRTLSRPALLREVRGNPNGVEEVANGTETGKEEDVKEETEPGISLIPSCILA